LELVRECRARGNVLVVKGVVVQENQLSILLVVSAVVLLALVVGGILYGLHRRQRQQALESQVTTDGTGAVWAGATVVSMRQLYRMGAETEVNVELRLLVQPPVGESYQALVTWAVDQAMLAQLLPGQNVSVRIDAADPQRVYPNMSGARSWLKN
jgi:hypothetical protein